MPKTRAEIIDMLERLDECVADDLEGQHLDFKQWDQRSDRGALRTVVSAAVCMANGGGGTVVFGVADRVKGRSRAVVGVPHYVDSGLLKRQVHDSTDPRLTPEFEEIEVQEGTGRLIAMHVHPGIPPYTDTAGRGWIRIDDECNPLTGALRRRLIEEAPEADYTSALARDPGTAWLSPAAMEALREEAAKAGAPEDLLGLDDHDLLAALGTVRDGRPARAALLIAGSPAVIEEHVPNYLWTYLRMSSPTDYSERVDGHHSILVALARILDRIMAHNPIETVVNGPYHHEYRTYPGIALREALLNALCHASYRIASPVLIKQHVDRVEITNPGGFIGGITPDNILHHRPAARNRRLVGALARLRLVNRSSLGVPRIYRAMLIDGKPPPRIEDIGGAVRITFRASRISPRFRAFVADELRRRIVHSVDELLVLRHLRTEWAADAHTAARLCQRSADEAREVLSRMEHERSYLDQGGDGRGAYWTLKPELRERLADSGRQGFLDAGPRAARERILSILASRADNDLGPLANRDLRRITGLDRKQVMRLLQRLREAGRVRIVGRGRGAGYVYSGGS